MGMCNSSDSRGAGPQSSYGYNRNKLRHRHHVESSNHPTLPTGSDLGIMRISDGAVENHAVHDGAILGIASTGMDEFATCGEDKTLQLCNLVNRKGTFRSSFKFTGHTKALTRATYGRKTGLIYSCSRDKTVRQWSRSGSTARRVFEGHDLACTAVALSEDEMTLWSGSRDTSVRAWDVQTGQCTSSTKLCLDSSKDGHQIITSCKGFNGSGCDTKLWDLRNARTPVREYTGHTQDATSCVFVEPQEEPCQGDKTEKRRAGGEEGSGGFNHACPKPCSPAPYRMIATASKDGTIKVYDLDSGNILANHAEPDCGGYTGLALAPHPDPSKMECQCHILFASTITGGVYALRLEAVGGSDGGGKQRRPQEDGVRVRCLGFVRGKPIL